MFILASELTTGRINNAKDWPKLLKALDKAVRRVLSLSKQEELLQLKGEFEFRFMQRRPFWNDEWETPSYRYVDFRLCRPWSTDTLREFTDLFAKDEDFRRGVFVQWRAGDGRTPAGLLQTNHTNSSRESLRRQEDRSFWEFGVSYFHERRPSHTAGDDAGREMRTAAEAMRLGELIIPGETAARFRIEGTLPGLRVSPSGKSPDRERPIPWHVSVDLYPSASESTKVFNECLNALIKMKGPPSTIAFRYLATGVVAACAQKCQTVSPVWDWFFFGKYRKGFDPLTPNSDSNDVRVYPVLEHEGDENQQAILVSAVHAGKKSFLELQTTEGRDVLESIAKSVGEKIEIV